MDEWEVGTTRLEKTLSNPSPKRLKTTVNSMETNEWRTAKVQTLPVTLLFKVEHKPDDPTHLLRVAQAYLRNKGIHLSDDLTIEI